MKDAVKKAIIRWYLSTSKTNDGGPGSGNFNHSGRPGEVGGSSPDGGGESSKELKGKKIRQARERSESLDDQIKFFQQSRKGFDDKKTVDVVETYSHKGDVRMNGMLRKTSPRSYKQQMEWEKEERVSKDGIKRLTNVIAENRLSDPAVVFRGIDTKEGLSKALGLNASEKEVEEMLRDPKFPQSLVGRTFSDPAFTSSSIDSRVPYRCGFADVCEMEIYCPEGTQGIYVGENSVYKREQEFLLQRGSQFVITDASVGYREINYKKQPYLKLKVDLVDQQPKDVPDRIEKVYEDPRKEILKTIKREENAPNEYLRKMYPDVPDEFIGKMQDLRLREKEEVKKKKSVYDTTFAEEEMHDEIVRQIMLGNLSPAQGSEVESYILRENTFEGQDKFIEAKEELTKSWRDIESYDRQRYQRLYPDIPLKEFSAPMIYYCREYIQQSLFSVGYLQQEKKQKRLERLEKYADEFADKVRSEMHGRGK